MALRQSVAKYIASQVDSSSSSDHVALRKRASDIMKGGTWAGEDIILYAVDYLQREIYVFMYIDTNGTSSKIYSPSSGPTKDTLLLIAFYEPGHYMSVQPIVKSHSLVATIKTSTSAGSASAAPTPLLLNC